MGNARVETGAGHAPVKKKKIQARQGVWRLKKKKIRC